METEKSVEQMDINEIRKMMIARAVVKVFEEFALNCRGKRYEPRYVARGTRHHYFRD